MPEQQTNLNQNNDPKNEVNNEGNQDDVSTLFTADEIKVKKETVASQKAEEDRRAKLSPEDLKKEDDAKALADKEKTDAEALNAVPEKYADFTVPEGMEIDQELLGEANPLFKELELSQVKAQKVIDLYASKILPAIMKKQADTWTATVDGWKASLKTDKEIGGDKYDASMKDALRVVNTLGTPELKKLFNDYSLGDHPEIVRVFARMASNLKEDTIDKDGKGGNLKPKTVEEVADRLYS